jgi:hypothetical protein
MRHLIYLGMIVFFISCSTTKTGLKKPNLRDEQTFLLTEISTDPTYGTNKNPIQTGDGPMSERRFLNALAGPNGERISYNRAGSCCPVKSKNGLMGMAMLDNYRVTWEGSKDTVSIYINMYDYSELKVPVGFTIKK